MSEFESHGHKLPPDIQELLKLPPTEARRLNVYNRIAKAYEDAGICVFCPIPNERIIAIDNGVVLFTNGYPRRTGDCLIAPIMHKEDYWQITEDEILGKTRLEKLAMELMSKTLGIKSFYLLIRVGKETDRTVSHLHWQIQNFEKGLVSWHPADNVQDPLEVANNFRTTLSEIRKYE